MGKTMFKRRLETGILCFALVFSFAGCAKTDGSKAVNASADSSAASRTVTDMMGRKVTVPGKVNHVISLSNNTSVDLYILDPDKLMGWSFTPKAAAKPYIDDQYFHLPVIATNTEDSANFENIIKMAPDVIVCSNEDEVYDPDKLQAQLGIPVVYVDIELNNTDKVYQFLGNVLGENSRGKKLAGSTRKTLDSIQKKVAAVPKGKRLKVYYAEGADWLQTDISGNVHTQVIDMAGGINAANISEDKTGSMAKVSLEQVIAWNPDVILVGATAVKGGFFAKVYSTPAWAGINAVKNKRIYQIPSLPFNWVDRPPSATRVLGVEWLANLLYPDTIKLDMKSETESYFNLFLHRSITGSQADDILNGVSSSSSDSSSSSSSK